MKILRLSGYLILALVLILGPLYGAGRILLPDWLKSQMASRLPEGSTLSIGGMSSTAKMGVQYNDIIFETADRSLKLKFDDLLVEPNLSLSQPANVLVGKGSVTTGETDLLVRDFKATVVLGYTQESEVSLSGQIKDLEDQEKAILSNIEFLIQGLNSREKSITAKAGELKLKMIVPKGPVIVHLTSVDLEADLNSGFLMRISAENSEVDLTGLGSGNPNRILRGQEIRLNAGLRDENQWILPIAFEAANLTSPIGKLGSSVSLKAKGVWQNPIKSCVLYDMLSNNKECGKMTDVVAMSFEFKEGNGLLSFKGNGYCVTPNAGCPQAIDSEIKTRETAEILSKVIMSGILDPIIGGVVLGALLSSPVPENSDYDHQANIEVKGNRIYLNGKPII